MADVSTNNTYGIHRLLNPGADGSLMSLNNGIASCSTVVYSKYDSIDPSCGRTQSFMAGMVSSTYKKAVANASVNTSQTWYSYDEFGRIIWTVQSVNGLTGNKTIDYTYTMNSNLTDVVYQAATPTERWEHKYNFDKLLRVDSVFTRQGSNGFMKQAAYYYYNYGALKRTELGGNLQGIDYTYTINGWLKAINDPNFVAATDPGGDGITGGTHPTFQKDVFGMTLEYYDNDYVRNNSFKTTSLGSVYPNQYNGNVRSSVWGTTANSATLMPQYAYTYDAKSQLLSATYGTNNGSQSFSPDPNNKYMTTGIAYDLNGNLLSLLRTDNAGTVELKDNIQYSYLQGTNTAPTTNMLQKTVNSASPTVTRTYSYNAIGQMTTFVPTGTGEISKYIIYDVFGHVTAVYANAQAPGPIVTYTYDDKGHRLSKTDYSAVSPYAATTTIYYIRDAAGSIISVYNNTTGTMAQAELPIYGKSRIGNAYCQPSSQAIYDYEITDHLGNMRATVSLNNNNTFVVSAYADYYPHGGVLPGRNGNLTNYPRYGYQGQFAEVDGETRYNAFDLRMYDPVTTRMISPDPMEQDWSPYMAMGNNHVNNIDPTGGTWLSHFEGWVGGGASSAGRYIGKEATHLWNWSPPGYKAFHNYEEKHKQTFIDIGVIAAAVVLAVATDGLGDALIADPLADFLGPEGTGILNEGLAEGVGNVVGGVTFGAVGGGAVGALQGWASGDKGSKFWQDVDLGMLGGAVGGGVGGLFSDAFLDGTEELAKSTEQQVFTYGLKGLASGAASGFAVGYRKASIDGYSINQSLKLGLTDALVGGTFGGVAGMGEGYLQGQFGLTPQERARLNWHIKTDGGVTKSIWRSIMTGAGVSPGQLWNAYRFKGNAVGKFAGSIFDNSTDGVHDGLINYLDKKMWGIDVGD